MILINKKNKIKIKFLIIKFILFIILCLCVLIPSMILELLRELTRDPREDSYITSTSFYILFSIYLLLFLWNRFRKNKFKSKVYCYFAFFIFFIYMIPTILAILDSGNIITEFKIVVAPWTIHYNSEKNKYE